MVRESDVVAVVNSAPGRTAIWHVAINDDFPPSRLCGAWVTEDPWVWRNVLATRRLLPIRGMVVDALTDCVSLTAGILDAERTHDGVVRTIAELDVRHRKSLTAAGKPRAEISWPRVPAPLSWDAMPLVPRGVVNDRFIAETIAVSRRVADLADSWRAVETARVSRDHLVGGNPYPRLFQAVLV